MKAKTPFFITPHGYRTWKTLDGDMYLVTGFDKHGERITLTTVNWTHASKLKLFRGSKWLLRDGHRYLIERTTPLKEGLH